MKCSHMFLRPLILSDVEYLAIDDASVFNKTTSQFLFI